MNDKERFDRFTKRARKVLRLAQEEAQHFNHNYIGTEHLLLGLIREGDGVAANVLGNLGVHLNKARAAVEHIIGRSDRIVLGTIGLTPRAKKVLELAVDEARELNHRYIGTEHVLLGLVHEGEGTAAQVLETLGVNVETVRTQTLQVLDPSGRHSANDPRPRPSKTPTLDQMGIDLTAQARQGKVAPVIGRDKDLERVIQVLSRGQQPRTGMRKNNVALISDWIIEPEPGTRKMAIIEGLAQWIISHRVSDKLQGKRLLTLDVGLLVAGSESQRELQERFKSIIEELRSSQDCIIVLDELLTLLGAGATEGRVDVAPLLVPALARGEIQCIGATTLDEYRTYIEKDPALQRHFQEVIVHEMITEETTLNPKSGESGTTRSTDMMSGTQPHVSPALKLHRGQVPAFTAEEMKAYLQGAPRCSLGPTLSGELPTVESIEFVGCRELTNRLHTYIGLADDALVCYVVLRGPFLLRGVSYPPGSLHRPPFSETEEEIYDASTGRLLVACAGSFKPRPGF